MLYIALVCIIIIIKKLFKHKRKALLLRPRVCYELSQGFTEAAAVIQLIK